MKFQIHGSMGDELGYTAAVREFKWQRPDEMIRIHGPFNPEIWANCPYLNIGNADDGRLVHVWSYERRTRETSNTRARYSMRMFGVDLARVRDEYPEFWFTEEELAQPIMVAATRSPRETRRAPLDLLVPPGLPNLIAVDPGAGWGSRVWPHENFDRLCEELDREGFTVVQVGWQGTHPLHGASYNLAHRLRLRAIARFLGRCALFVGNDSGLFHIAAAVGCPQVVVYGVSRYAAAPYPSTLGIEPAFECDPNCYTACARRVAGCDQVRHCMEEISVDQVMAAIKGALARPRPPDRLTSAPTPAQVYERLYAGRELQMTGSG